MAVEFGSSTEDGNNDNRWMCRCHTFHLVLLVAVSLVLGGVVGGLIGAYAVRNKAECITTTSSSTEHASGSIGFDEDAAEPNEEDKGNEPPPENTDFGQTHLDVVDVCASVRLQSGIADASWNFPETGSWRLQKLEQVEEAWYVELSDNTLAVSGIIWEGQTSTSSISMFRRSASATAMVRAASSSSSVWTPEETWQSNSSEGVRISLASDGGLLATGGYEQPIRVYRYNPASSPSWSQFGQDIESPINGLDVFWPGRAGSTPLVAYCGPERVVYVNAYNATTETWEDQHIYPAIPADSIDCSVALARDGRVLALGEEGYNSGQVRVFHYDEEGRSWSQVGQNLTESTHPYSSFGTTVKLSESGNVLAVASRRYNRSLGLVRIFSLDTDGEKWVQVGQDLTGSRQGGQFGWTMDLSRKGNVVAVGSRGEDPLARVYYLDAVSSKWVLSQEFNTNNNSPGVNSVSLSPDGTTIAIADWFKVHLYAFDV